VQGWLAEFLPDTEEGIYFWLAVLTLGYMGIVAILQVWATSLVALERQLLKRTLDAITFSTSLVLLVGLMHKPLLEALGNTKPFLFMGGVLGLCYSIYAAIRRH
jgi:hypothetical protein